MLLNGKKLCAEALGTFILVFVGTAAIALAETGAHGLEGAGIAAVFGLAVTAMVHVFGPVSGAHLNPAVTVALAAASRFRWSEVASYLSAQSLGALAASLVLRGMLPGSLYLGTTRPTGGGPQSIIVEFILTLILMLVILRSTSESSTTAMPAALAIGGTVGLGALVGGPVSGASMNPARSLAPALVSGHCEHLWIYLAAPVAGALFATVLYRFIAPAPAKPACPS